MKTRILMLPCYAVAAVALLLHACGKRPDDVNTQSKALETVAPAQAVLPWHHPDSCRECHEEAYGSWKQSHHALAQRNVLPERDAEAFAAGEVTDETGQRYRLEGSGDPESYVMETLFDEGKGDTQRYAVRQVIGETPLIQYLVEGARGRLQTHALTWDPHKKEWYNVFGAEERSPGDWGHWTGQGMNWNSNCAWCHMTEFEKNYDFQTDSYQSAWLHQGVTCVQCHDGMEEHVTVARAGNYVDLPPVPEARVMDNCASCHSRRDELTKNAFRLGEVYEDHYRLTLPDWPGAYFVDGQANEEDYVYASLRLSKMGEKGVVCMDCHDPHSAKAKLPFENNALCIQCHSTGNKGATLIDPVAHSRHQAGSSGAMCVNCHMPERTYMGRDPRRDHGFTSPDPHLSMTYGVPNACTSCHQDQDNAWAAEKVSEWYGSTPRKQLVHERADLLNRWESGDAAVWEPTLERLALETNAYWQATWLRLLAPYADRSGVLEAGSRHLESAEPIVREAALRILGYRREAIQQVAGALEDESRMVRIRAADTIFTVAGYQDHIPALREWKDQVEMNADRPSGALRRAELALQQGDRALSKQLILQAIRMDRNNAQLRYDAAILLDRAGEADEALAQLRFARSSSPDFALIPFAQGLLYAGKNDFVSAAKAIEDALRLDPSQDRWWYNLALAQLQLRDSASAKESLEKAIELNPSEPAYRQALRGLGSE